MENLRMRKRYYKLATPDVWILFSNKTFKNKEKLNPRARHIIMDSRMVRGTEFRGKIIKY